VNTLSLDELTDVSLRARWNRHRRVVIPVIAVLLVVGAFLEWGPIGLGNGPLRIGADDGEFGAISSRIPVALVSPIGNTSSSALVIDGVQLLGNGSCPAPHVLTTEAMSFTWPATRTSWLPAPDLSPEPSKFRIPQAGDAWLRGPRRTRMC
jgi:hypothetical protein